MLFSMCLGCRRCVYMYCSTLCTVHVCRPGLLKSKGQTLIKHCVSRVVSIRTMSVCVLL